MQSHEGESEKRGDQTEHICANKIFKARKGKNRHNPSRASFAGPNLRVNNIKRATFAHSTLKWIRRANDAMFCCILTVTALLGGLALTQQIPRSLGAEFKPGLSLK